jgi:hypothetical protein
MGILTRKINAKDEVGTKNEFQRVGMKINLAQTLQVRINHIDIVGIAV